MTQTDVVEKTEIKLAKPKKWAVVLHNDDITPQDFVVALLVEIFRHTPQTAVELMLQVHNEGKAAAGIYPYEVAEAKHAEAVQTVRLNGRMLKITMEEQDA